MPPRLLPLALRALFEQAAVFAACTLLFKWIAPWPSLSTAPNWTALSFFMLIALNASRVFGDDYQPQFRGINRSVIECLALAVSVGILQQASAISPGLAVSSSGNTIVSAFFSVSAALLTYEVVVVRTISGFGLPIPSGVEFQ